MKSVYVGNLPYGTTDAELRELFERHGKVFDAKIKTDRDTGRPLGYGFVMLDDDEASRIMQELDGSDFQGRALKVNESRQRNNPPSRRPFRDHTADFSRPPRHSFREQEGDENHFERRPGRKFRSDDREESVSRPYRSFRRDDRDRNGFQQDSSGDDGENPERRHSRNFRFDGRGKFTGHPRRSFPENERRRDGFHRDFKENDGEKRSFRPRRQFKNDSDGNMTDHRFKNDGSRPDRGPRRDFTERKQWKRGGFRHPGENRGDSFRHPD